LAVDILVLDNAVGEDKCLVDKDLDGGDIVDRLGENMELEGSFEAVH
jgi:predicted nuclease of predicted toxin-antitoxin system